MNEADLAVFLAGCTAYCTDIVDTIARFRGDICKIYVDADVRWTSHSTRLKPCVECKAPVCQSHGAVCDMCNAHCCRECFDAKKGMVHVRISHGSKSVSLCRIHVAQCHPKCTEITILGPSDYEDAGRCRDCRRIPCSLHSAFDMTTNNHLCVGCCGVCAECLEPINATPSGYIWHFEGRALCMECRNELCAQNKRARIREARRCS